MKRSHANGESYCLCRCRHVTCYKESFLGEDLHPYRLTMYMSDTFIMWSFSRGRVLRGHCPKPLFSVNDKTKNLSWSSFYF